MKKILVHTVIILFCRNVCAQSTASLVDTGIYKSNNLTESYIEFRDTASISEDKLLQLKQAFGQHKKYPAGYEKLVLAALSFFPEIKEYRVSFKVRKHGAPLSSRPAYGTIFRHASKREYMVFISADTSTQWKVLQINRVPEMAQIGIIGHELSHIIEFRQKTSFGLIGVGFNHVSTNYMNKFEFQADSICIAHGMGEYLLAWGINARRGFGATDPEQLEVRGEMSNYHERYMSPATIRRYMQEMEASK
jgi:hypothetical protein